MRHVMHILNLGIISLYVSGCGDERHTHTSATQCSLDEKLKTQSPSLPVSPPLSQQVKSMNIEVYTTSSCPYCVRAKKLLEKKGLPYTEIDVSDRDARDAMMVRAKGRRSVPQIFINGEHIGGSDDLFDLEHDGKLDRMIQPDMRAHSS